MASRLPPPPLPPLLLLLVILLAALVGLGDATAIKDGLTKRPCYSEHTCRAVCKYGNLYLKSECRRCHPDLCLEEPRTAIDVKEDPQLSTDDTSGRSLAPTAPPGYTAPAPGCIDQNGLPREPQASWADDELYPCILYNCPKEGGNFTMDDLSVNCPERPENLGSCTASRNIGQCCFNYTCTSSPSSQLACVDSSGQLRKPDEVWNDDDTYTCVTFVCSNGVVKQVTDLRVLCSPSPGPHCEPYRAENDCCFSYNCTIVSNQTLCRDSNGSYRRDGDFWYDDVTYPCVKYVCRDGITEVEYDLSGTCKAPEPGCRGYRPSGACCYNYTCGCVYEGAAYQEGEEFVDDVHHQCRLLRCDNTVVVTVEQLAVCEVLNCSVQVHPEGECCRRCASCLVGGVEYHEGDTLYDNLVRPCRRHRCESGQVVFVEDERLACAAAPDPQCTPWHMEGRCCPKWDCDEQPCMIDGVKHDHGTTWPEDPEKPCKHFICNNSKVLTFSEEPPCEPAPYPHCILRDVPYQCCPDWDCVSTQCRYGSEPALFYSENQKWYDDPSFPCKQFTCTKAGVVKTLDLAERCEPLNPPDCRTERKLGDCCKRCVPKPAQCYDNDGVGHDPNDSYFEDPDTQCVFVRCLHNTTVTIYDRRRNCPRDPRLTNPRCSQVATEDCCPVYHCPACEYQGRQYEQGERWWDSDQRQCTRYLCGFDGIKTTVFTRLPCLPVPAGCVANYRGYECCHYKYTCMYDPHGVLIPMPQPGSRNFDFDN